MQLCQESTRTTGEANLLIGMLLVLLGVWGCAQPSGEAAVEPVPGAEEESSDMLLLTGLDEEGRYAKAIPFEVDEAALQRGEDAYGTYCATCHGGSGDGRGPVFEATGVQASDLRTEYVQQQPDGQIFVTISRGMGTMVGFESQLSPQDRWAVVAYLRTFQQGGGS